MPIVKDSFKPNRPLRGADSINPGDFRHLLCAFVASSEMARSLICTTQNPPGLHFRLLPGQVWGPESLNSVVTGKEDRVLYRRKRYYGFQNLPLRGR